jgi:4-diphosphocytidyl-2-C-methyl-D-erythritol kinase
MPSQPDAASAGLEGTTRSLRAPAYAKINLSLEILGKRPDGFHELVSVVQTVSLADHLTVWPAPHLKIAVEPPVVEEHDNLVRRAAEALALATGQAARAEIHLRKDIPVAAGLGGGSSDAATTLRLLDRLWGTRLSDARMADIAATLGSDVALFLGGGTMLMRGRGEVVEPLPPVQPFWVVLVCPGGGPPDKTRALYRALSPDDWTDGRTTLRLAGRMRGGAAIDRLGFVNAFDGAADRVYADFPGTRRRLADLTGTAWHLTGAGPSLFTCCTSPQQARSTARILERAGIAAHVARSIARRPNLRASHAPSGRSSK